MDMEGSLRQSSGFAGGQLEVDAAEEAFPAPFALQQQVSAIGAEMALAHFHFAEGWILEIDRATSSANADRGPNPR